MTTWYSVDRFAEHCVQTFNTRDEAELYAIAMTVVTGENWFVNQWFGY